MGRVESRSADMYKQLFDWSIMWMDFLFSRSHVIMSCDNFPATIYFWHWHEFEHFLKISIISNSNSGIRSPPLKPSSSHLNCSFCIGMNSNTYYYSFLHYYEFEHLLKTSVISNRISGIRSLPLKPSPSHTLLILTASFVLFFSLSLFSGVCIFYCSVHI